MTQIQTDPNIFLSIVTISFNQADYLGALLDSVCSQMANDVEFIVVDPGSTDGSREMLNGRRDCINYLLLEPDEGPADGLNRGFALARGQIGYFINSDDLMMPRAVATLRRLWAANPVADIMLGGAWMIDAEGRPIRELHATRNVALDDFLHDRAILVQQGMSFRISTFRELGGFNAANRTCWDYELLCRMLAHGKKALSMPERLGGFRITGDNLSGAGGGIAFREANMTDKARIYRDLARKDPPARPNRQFWNRIFKLLVNLDHTWTQAADRLMPTRVAVRWQDDCGNE